MRSKRFTDRLAALEADKMKLKDPSLLRTEAYINGAWVGAEDGRVFDVHNPADGSLIAEVADLGADAITAAIDAAVSAQKAWAATPAKTRAIILRRWYDLVVENTDDLAMFLTPDMGKPLAEAK
jgi:succinate-semialdehyde dehydrogenase/glutarate-semialdehyde dehydrogenase